MDKKITDFIVTELKIGRWMLAPIDLLLFAAAPVFAFMMRSSVASYTCMDTESYIRMSDGLKILTGCFDLLLAIVCAMLVYEMTAHKIKAFLAYAIILMLPVLCAGCAMWGMGDSVYVFFAVVSLYLLICGKGNAAVMVYGISLFLNRYAFFLLPIYAICFMQKKAKLAAYLVPLCGAWFRNGIMNGDGYCIFPIFEAEKLFTQSRGETLLSFHWPNLFQMIGPDKFVAEYSVAAKILAATLMLCIVVAAIMRRRELTKQNIVTAALAMSVLFPFIMPQMDERCGLMADVLIVVFAMQHMEMAYLAVAQIVISYMAYSAYFRGESVVPLCYVALAELCILLVLLCFAGSGKRPVFTLMKKEQNND